MKNFKWVNTITGWIVFAIASTVYILTIEPTASFWDCGEFISTAFKLEVGHPPGAPLFMLYGRIATMLAGGNVLLVPKMINTMSALASGFTILFLFWTITHLARKIVGKTEGFTAGETIAIIGSGIVGALAYTFSDTFWFSAVEGEVYASSSFFTAIVFWAILKWENIADEKYSNRWLVLIAYLMGLSIGVHLLNLLAIPAIVLVYYYKKYKPTTQGVIIAVLLSFVLLGFVMYGIIQGIITVATWFELLFVNGFGLPFTSGLLFMLVLIIALIIFGIWYTEKNGKALWNTVILCFAVIIFGYSSYAAIVIRSSANPPMDQNNPETMFNLKYYLDREQYGDRPLLFGAYYNAPIQHPRNEQEQKEMEQGGGPIYTTKDGKYVIASYKPKYKFDPRFNTIFPRMYSRESNHIEAYKQWANIKGVPIQIENDNGQLVTAYKPTFFENLKFFFNYQLNFMYFRYFMWNFSGRQNDMQSYGSILKGNWITGIDAIDNVRLGPQDKLPKNLAENRARNKYYMLPLLLGLIGFFFQLYSHKKDFSVVLLLFFMTGIAIVIYLNQTPYQPRERDYAYAGSFYAFAIWIGLGVLAIVEWMKKKLPHAPTAVMVTLVSLVCVPGIMAHENWDDHDRSGRYTVRDFAYDYLNSCAKNAVLFTNGDNDTFPLWYAQEVEGIRTDVRVVNLSYLGADWYIEQMERKAYDSDPVPFSMTRDKYVAGTRDVVYVIDRFKDYENLKDVMDFLASDDPKTKTIPGYGDNVDYIPARKLRLPVDSAAVVENHVISKKLIPSMVKEMHWEIKGNAIYKNDMMVLDLLAHDNWTRPIYFAITVSDDNYQNIQKYFQLQGLAYRIVPIEYSKTSADGQSGSVDTDILYENLVNKFKWGNIADPKVYLDENNLRMLSNFRNNFARLADALIEENKVDSAVVALNKCMEVMPISKVPLNYWSIPIIEQYYRANKIDVANSLAENLFNNTFDELKYYFRIKGNLMSFVQDEKQMDLIVLNRLASVVDKYGQKELAKKINDTFQNYYMSIQN